LYLVSAERPGLRAGDELGRLRTYHRGGPGGYTGLTPCDAVNIPQHKLEPVPAAALLARGGQLLFNTECLEIRETPGHACPGPQSRHAHGGLRCASPSPEAGPGGCSSPP
jgi:hypothetical protein